MSVASTELDLVVSSTSEAAGRPTNEDAIHVGRLPRDGSADAGYVLAIADGAGGLQRAGVASRLAIDAIATAFAADRPADIALALKQAYRRANEAIFKETADGDEIGTTLVSAVVHGKYVTIANVGDSRAYLLRANQLTQITQDHTPGVAQAAHGRIEAKDGHANTQRNALTAVLGAAAQLDRRLPSIYEFTLLPEDRLLLCSDGFYGVMKNEDYLRVLDAKANTQGDAARQLADLAQQRGTTDNVSAIVVAVSPSTAAVQRQQIGAEIAAQAPGRFAGIVLPAIVLLIVIVAIAVGAFIYLM